MRAPVITLALVLAHSLSAAVTNLRPVSPLEVAERGGAFLQVTAGPPGWFLANGRRVTSTGEVLDAQPLPGSAGSVFPWAGGWITVSDSYESSNQRSLLVRTISVHGTVDPLMTIRLAGQSRPLLASSGNVGLLVVQQILDDAWVHHYAAGRLTHVQRFPARRAAAVTATQHGYLLLLTPLPLAEPRRADLVLLAHDGRPVDSASVEAAWRLGASSFELHSNGGSSLLVGNTTRGLTFTIIAADLEQTEPIILNQDVAVGSSLHSVLPLPDGFFVSYRQLDRAGAPETRAAIISNSGEVHQDGPADVIASGAANGDRYLIVRPWGDAAIAHGDPQTIITSAFPLTYMDYPPSYLNDAVVSGAVTMSLYHLYDSPNGLDSTRAIRVDMEGRPLDREAIVLPPGAGVAGFDGGFAVVWHQEDWLMLRRLSLLGGWIDLAPMQIAAPLRPTSIDVASDGERVLLAWAGVGTVWWRLARADGSWIGEINSISLPRSRVEGNVKVERGKTGWLLTVTNGRRCDTPCPAEPTPLHFLTLDDGGAPNGPVRWVGADVREIETVGLADGTWVIAVDNWVIPSNDVGILHLSTTGDLIGRAAFPLPAIPTAMRSTLRGWRGAFEGVVVEFEAFDIVRSLEMAHSELRSIEFGAGDLLILSDNASPTDSSTVDRIYSGTLSTPDGDLALRLTSVRRAYGVKAKLEVENRSPFSVTPELIVDQGWETLHERLPVLESGESVEVSMSLHPVMPILAVHLVAEEVRDISPDDNTAFISIEGLPSSLPRRGAAPGRR